jgi:hypothetical protein
MVSLLFIGVVTALAVVAILVKICAGRPKKAEKWEKGEIIKQLLTLSDRENSISAAISPPTRSLRPASAAAARSDTLGKFTQQENNSKRKYSPMGPKPTIPPKLKQADDVEEQIRQRAYELYQGRGGAGGNPTEDWQQARQEVLSRKAKAGTTSS